MLGNPLHNIKCINFVQSIKKVELISSKTFRPMTNENQTTDDLVYFTYKHELAFYYCMKYKQLKGIQKGKDNNTVSEIYLTVNFIRRKPLI